MFDRKKMSYIGAGLVLCVAVAVIVLYRSPGVRSQVKSLTRTEGVGTALTPDSFGIAQPSAAGFNGSDAAEARMANVAYDTTRPPTPAPSVAPVAPGDKRLIIQTGQVSLVVKDVSATIATIAQLTAKSGGYVVDQNYYKSDVAPTGFVTIRIPSKTFNQGLEAVRKLGDVVSESLNGSDVTAEYTDLGSQLRNYRASEVQLLEIMKRAGSISDVLEVQNQLSSVRSQIEVTQGRMKYLEQSASLSLLTINLSTDKSSLPIVEKEGEKWKPIVIVKEAARSLLDVGKSLAEILIWLVVFIPVWLGIGVILWLVARKVASHITKT
jgi:hypothetical protein